MTMRAPVTAPTLTHRVIDSAVGPLTLAGVGPTLMRLTIAGQTGVPTATRAFPDAADQLAAYFAGSLEVFTLQIRLAGSEFQRRVWAAVRRIPYGETRSYGQIADEIGSPGASRAVGTAAGRNPLPIIVPCHRVVGSSGALTGYVGGIDCKRALLDLERQHCRRSRLPGL